MLNKVSFHLVYEADSHLDSFDLAGLEAFSCKRLDHELLNFRTDSIIPTTLLHNVARSTSPAQYFLFGDANLSPSKEMKTQLSELIEYGNITESSVVLIPSQGCAVYDF